MKTKNSKMVENKINADLKELNTIEKLSKINKEKEFEIENLKSNIENFDKKIIESESNNEKKVFEKELKITNLELNINTLANKIHSINKFVVEKELQIEKFQSEISNLSENLIQLTKIIDQLKIDYEIKTKELISRIYELEIHCDKISNSNKKLQIDLSKAQNEIKNQYISKTIYDDLNISKNRIIESYKLSLCELEQEIFKEKPQKTRERFNINK